MKISITTAILLILVTACFSQQSIGLFCGPFKPETEAISNRTLNAVSLKDLILKYEAYCNEVIQDTILEYGEIKPREVPVKNKASRVLYYTEGPPDTLWAVCKCMDFKYGNHDIQFVGFGGWTVSNGSGIILESRPGTVYVTRDKTCLVHRRKVEPWSADFWEWIKSN